MTFLTFVLTVLTLLGWWSGGDLSAHSTRQLSDMVLHRLYRTLLLCISYDLLVQFSPQNFDLLSQYLDRTFLSLDYRFNIFCNSFVGMTDVERFWSRHGILHNYLLLDNLGEI